MLFSTSEDRPIKCPHGARARYSKLHLTVFLPSKLNNTNNRKQQLDADKAFSVDFSTGSDAETCFFFFEILSRIGAAVFHSPKCGRCGVSITQPSF